MRWARAHGKPLVGNGDVHRLAQLGTTYSLVDAAPDPASICAAVAAGRTRVCATPHSWPTAIGIMASLMTTAALLPFSGAGEPGPGHDVDESFGLVNSQFPTVPIPKWDGGVGRHGVI